MPSPFSLTPRTIFGGGDHIQSPLGADALSCAAQSLPRPAVPRAVAVADLPKAFELKDDGSPEIDPHIETEEGAPGAGAGKPTAVARKQNRVVVLHLVT